MGASTYLLHFPEIVITLTQVKAVLYCLPTPRTEVERFLFLQKDSQEVTTKVLRETSSKPICVYFSRAVDHSLTLLFSTFSRVFTYFLNIEGSDRFEKVSYEGVAIWTCVSNFGEKI